MKNFLILFFTFSTISAQAQSDSIGGLKPIIKLDLLSLLPPYSGPSLRLGIELSIKDNFALYSEVGKYVPLNERFAFKNTDGTTAKLEFKRYQNMIFDGKSNYFSLELFYKYHSYDTSDSINLSAANDVYLKEYSVIKNIGSISFKFGQLQQLTPRLFFDKYVGLGIRYKNAVNSLSRAENETIVGDSDYSPNIIESKAGNFIYPNIIVGLKIGFSAKKNPYPPFSE